MLAGFIQQAAATEVTASSISKAYASNNSAGSLLFCVVYQLGALAVAVTDNNGNGTWTALPRIEFQTGPASYVQAFYKLNCAGGANTVTATLTGGSSTLDMIIGEWGGVTALDQHVEGTTSSTNSPTSGTAVNATTDVAIGYAAIYSGASTWDNTSDTTYTLRSASNRASLYSKENIAAATYGFKAHSQTAAAAEAAGMATFTVRPYALSKGPRTVTIDHGKCGASDSTNFPLLFSGVYPYLATVANGGVVNSSSGYDIIFTSDAAGTTLLNWEIESYDPVTGTVNFWVKVPTLSHSADTKIYLWYGDQYVITLQGGAQGAAWDSTFALVSHMSTSARSLDSTSNNAGVNSNSATSGTGQIDGCGVFAGGSLQNISWNNEAAQQITPSITLSAWVNLTSSTSTQCVIVKGSSADYALLVGNVHGGDLAFNSAGWKNTVSGGYVALNTWTYIAVTHNGTSDLFYVNGVLKETIADVKVLGTSANTLNLGVIQGGFSPLTGSIDEAHVANVIRSADWLLSEYNNQNSPSTFYKVSSLFVPTCGAFGVGI